VDVSRLFKRTNTAQHILFAGEIFLRPSDIEVKASAVNTKNARLLKAGILLEKQQEGQISLFSI
jgi:hypothetical protein